MTYVYKEYEIKIKNGTGAKTTAKNKVFSALQHKFFAGEEGGWETPPIPTCLGNPPNMSEI